MLDDLNLPDYNILGYKITKQVVEDHYIKEYPIPPEKLITVDSIIGYGMPSFEFLDWVKRIPGHRKDFIKIYNIDQNQVTNLINYITDQWNKGYIGWEMELF
ncbi:MAG: hypothetical protein NTY09_09680 [bacterium]|nr:hypothetical protein [bacterium]